MVADTPSLRPAIALVGPLPPPSGGMANQTLQLARLLQEDGSTVDVVQVNRPYRPAWIAHVRGVRALFRLVPYLIALWRSAGRADLVHVMANSGWAWHLFAAPAIWMARVRRVPVIVNYRGGEAEAFLRRQARWVLPSLRRADAVVVPSAFLQGVFAQWNIKAEIVPNIVDLSRFSPPLHGEPRHDLLVSRNLEDIYDNGTAIRAFAIIHGRHPQSRLIVAGSGPKRADLEALCVELAVADAVTFTGRIDNEGMAVQYRRAGVMLNASLVDNMPISLLEAMASGTPIVTTNVGGIPFMVQHEVTALLVPPGDPAAMAGAALRLIEDRALAERQTAAAIEAARRYTWSSVRPQLYAMYARATGRAAAPTKRASP